MSTLIRPAGSIETIAAVHSQCPLWVISGHVPCKKACPLYPRKRTVVRIAIMALICVSLLLGRPAFVTSGGPADSPAPVALTR